MLSATGVASMTIINQNVKLICLKNVVKKFNFEKKEKISLLMVCHANEETYKNIWYLDIGCNIHMCRDKLTLSDLDESFYDSMKLSDNSKVSVIGKGKETILTNGNYVQTIFNVFFCSRFENKFA